MIVPKRPSRICPTCQSKKDVVRIVYGLPTEEEMAGEWTTETGPPGSRDIILGGCVVPEDAPTWHCLKCQSSW